MRAPASSSAGLRSSQTERRLPYSHSASGKPWVPHTKKPRPGVDFPTAVALKDSDRQAIGNGITTVFHGVTASWEPGLRSMEMARSVLQELERARPELAADTRLHLRYETYNLDATAEIA